MEKVKFIVIFNIYFLNMYISLDIILAFTKFSTCIENILMQGNVSLNCHLGLSFDLMTKKRVVKFIIYYIDEYGYKKAI